MRKTYRKPEACCMNTNTGKVTATSEAYAEKSKEIFDLFRNVRKDTEILENSNQTTD